MQVSALPVQLSRKSEIILKRKKYILQILLYSKTDINLLRHLSQHLVIQD